MHHRSVLFNIMLTGGTLWQHLAETDKQAEEMFSRLVNSELAEKWLQNKSLSVKSSTFARYKSISEKYLIAAFGNETLSNVTTDMIEDLMQRLLLNGRKNQDGGLSPETVSDIPFPFCLNGKEPERTKPHG